MWQAEVFVSYKKPVLEIYTSLFGTGHIILENDVECLVPSVVRTRATVLKSDYNILLDVQVTVHRDKFL